MKKEIFALLIVAMFSESVKAQFNCNVFKLENNQPCYDACVLATEASEFQGSRESQVKFDSAIRLCPTFAYAYFEKSVPYIKRGDLKTWKQIIDKAVENDSLYLGYRGWCRFQFARDYRGALTDFADLRKYAGGNLGFSQNGDYDLRVVEALCYDQLSESQTGVEILEKFIDGNSAPGSFALLHLGIMKVTQDKFSEAIVILQKAISENEYLADNYYYLAVALHQENRPEDAMLAIEKAVELYNKGYFRKDAYTNPVGRVYRSQLEGLREKLQ